MQITPTQITRPTLKHLNDLRAIPLTLDLARCKQSATDDAAAARLDAALHEAAHLCAAAVVRSYVHTVFVNPSQNGRRRPSGQVQSDEQPEDPLHEIFVSIVGYEWEALHTGQADGYGSEDLKLARSQARGSALWAGNVEDTDELLLRAQTAARRFVAAHSDQIRMAAAGILLTCNARGYVGDKRIWALIDWVRPQLPSSFDALLTRQNLCC